MYIVLENRRTLPLIPLNAISRHQQQLQPRSTFQTWSSTSFDDDGHYSDIHSDVGVPARISAQHSSDYVNYAEFNQQAVDDTLEQHEIAPDDYQGLDRSALETLRLPPVPHEYASLSLNTPN